MSAEALLERLTSLQIELWLEGGARLRFRAPQGALTDSLRVELKEQREALITHLRQSQEPGPLTLGQQALVFHNQLLPESSAYNVSLTLRLRGPLLVESLAAALADLSDVHPLLAAGLRATAAGDELYRAPGAVLQLRTQLPALSPQLIRTCVLFSSEVPFRLREEPLTRAALYPCTDGDAVLHLCCHHLVSDGASSALILRDLAVLYAHHRAGTPPPLRSRYSFTEFVRWQAAFLNSAEAAAQRRYWMDLLAGELPVVQLPVDRRRHGVRSERGDEVPLEFGPALTQKLRALAVDLGVTPSALLLAGLVALCARYGEQDEVLIGVPYSGRSDLRFAGVVGYFVNTLPLRLRCKLDQPLAALARGTAAQLSDAIANGDYPLARLVQELPRARAAHLPPLHQVVFGFHSLSTGELLQFGGSAEVASLPFADLSALPFPLPQQNGQDDLGVTIFDLGTEFAGKLSYSTELFERATAQRMAGHLLALLRGAVDAPELSVGRLPLLSTHERQAVSESWNDTAYPRPAAWSVPGRLSMQAAATPAAVALQSDDRCLTYAELERQSNQLACHLRRLGVGTDVLVGLYLPRTPELVVAIYAVFKAGGAYLPLDPALPRERLRWQLSDSAVKLVLAVRAQLPPADEGVQVLILDEANLAGESTTAPQVTIEAHHLAYAIYTSGSTGWPKAALIEHGSLQNQLLWFQRTHGFGVADVTLQQAPASFDVSVWELLVPMLSGAQLILARPGGQRETRYLATLIERFGVRVAGFVPVLLRALLADLEPGRCSSLRQIFCGGEVLDPDLAAACRRQLPQAELINLYGPTECTVWATSWRCGVNEDPVPIGRPVDNTQTYVLDPRGQPTPIGVAGELYIGGIQVGRGYLNRPELTAERFVGDPFAADKSARLYRTGDKARWLPSGTLEFLGRLDGQVKLRGNRIELGEIEAALREQPGVRDCAVALWAPEKNDPRLVAYLVPQADAQLLWPKLRAALQRRLPEVMIPALWMEISALPQTSSGKLDRKRLPPPDYPSIEMLAATPAASPEPPRTPTEAALVAIFAAVLKQDGLDANAHFFDLGGHSLLVLQVTARIRQQLGVELPLRAIFDTPTIRLLAPQITALSAVPKGPLPTASFADGNRSMPLSPSQRFIWQYETRFPGRSYYNVPDAMWLRGPLDMAALQRALDALLVRHETLRVRIEEQSGELVQHPEPPLPWPLLYRDLTTQATAGSLAEARKHAVQLARDAAGQPFDLTVPPLARAVVYRTAPEEHLVLLVLHHLVTDGWSMTILWSDLAALYTAATTATPPALPPLTARYGDYVRELLALLSEERLNANICHFRQRLAELPALRLPTDFPRPAVRRFRGELYELHIDTALARSLQALALACDSTRYMVLLTALAVQLAVWSGQSVFRLGMPVAARIRPSYEGLIGCFTNTVLLGIDLRAEQSFAAAVSRVREIVLDALAYELTPIGEVVAAVDPQPLSGFPAGFQVSATSLVLSYPTLPGFSVQPVAIGMGIAKRDLHFYIIEHPDRIQCGLMFDSDLFTAANIAAFAAGYLTQLGRVVVDPSVSIRALGVRPGN